MTRDTGFATTTPIGTYEDALKMIGFKTEIVRADVALDYGLMFALNGVLEDPNPVYWDAQVSRNIFHTEVVPGALLLASFTPLRWRPNPSEVSTIARSKVPLPGETLINVSTEETYLRPLRLGDWLSRSETLIAVSPEKATALGPGHFVTTQMDYFDDSGNAVAVGKNILLRFKAKEKQ
jgi:hypothetical protein